ncbi:MAG: hypothetical protein ACR2NY_01610 [Alphaproteobacteria bacterium]
MKVYFITFANKKGYFLAPATYHTKRIVDEATSSGYFDVVMDFSEEKLDTIFWQTHKKFIKQHQRGFGFWIWKPQITWQVLQTMHDGDILCYADAGSRIQKNPKAKKLMQHYIKKVAQSKYGFLSFQTHQPEQCFSKQDLLLFLKADNKIKTSGQLLGGIWLLKKSPHTIKLVKQWLHIATHHDYHLLDDSPSSAPNHKNFREHRHDQAILSILRKKYGADILPDHTKYIHRRSIPIVATRQYKKYWWRFLSRFWHKRFATG